MHNNNVIRYITLTLPFVLAVSACPAAGAASAGDSAESPALQVSALKPLGRVDERFVSYNVESVEVTGGNFWAPYPKPGESVETYDSGPESAGFSTDQYRKREPLDLRGNKRLRTLTKALGPAYMRVSGTWANSIYFQDNDVEPKEPPAGYQGVLTRKQWAGVVEFGDAVDAKILTSFAVSEGARDAEGAWNPAGARALFAYTAALGGNIDAVELMNEPNVRPQPYAPQDYARDHNTLQSLVEEVSPDTLLVGPGSTGEAGFKLFANPPEQMSTARLLSGSPRPEFDAFSYHYYGAVSQRCKSLGERDPENPREVTTSIAEALSESWLVRADQAQDLYRGMRDRFAPGAPIWVTESAQAACGGDPWSASFLDTFRFVDQLGRGARNGIDVIFHNTLAASDYALISDETWLPRPSYWAALLWRRLLGETVLDTGANRGDVHTYAHCMRDQSGGVTMVAINFAEKDRNLSLAFPGKAMRYTLTAQDLLSEQVQLNGESLKLSADESLPSLQGSPLQSGELQLPAHSISYIPVADADNPACL